MEHVRTRLMHWLWRDDRPRWASAIIDPLVDPAAKVLCLVFGHLPERDQCGMPEHDFCLWCLAPQPDLGGK